jgi:diguanylate cyclase (GGDEF)-like protein
VRLWWSGKAKNVAEAARLDDETEQLAADELRRLAREANIVGATLTVLRGQGSGKVFWLRPGANVLGRSEQTGISIPMTGVSRRHAQIVESGGLYLLEDLGSTNGTFLRGDPVTDRVELRSGDQINLGGHAVLRFALEVSRDESQGSLLYDAATRDRLTSTRSRRIFHEQLGEEWAWTENATRACGLILMDVDDLGRVNREHGSETGDYILRELVRRISGEVGPSHALARTGGGTFGLFCRASTRSQCIRMAEQLRAAMADTPVVWYGKTLTVTLSLGVASSEEPAGGSPQALLALAEDRLRTAKKTGKNRCVFGTPLDRVSEPPSA